MWVSGGLGLSDCLALAGILRFRDCGVFHVTSGRDLMLASAPGARPAEIAPNGRISDSAAG
jgi:hypothetical protein